LINLISDKWGNKCSENYLSFFLDEGNDKINNRNSFQTIWLKLTKDK